MSNSYAVIPINDEKIAQESITWVQANKILFASETYPYGHFPAQDELVVAIENLGYQLEESDGSYITSEYDLTQFIDLLPSAAQNQSDIVWFEHGNIFLLDVIQELTNTCGTFLIVDMSGSTQLLLVPDSVLQVESPKSEGSTYIKTMIHRMPHMIEQLREATVTDAHFLLSQIRQAIECSYGDDNFMIRQSAREGIEIGVYQKYLSHPDDIARFLAFDIIRRFKSDFYSMMPALQQAIINEADNDTKVDKIWALESFVSRLKHGGGISDEQAELLNETLLSLVNNLFEEPPVRLAAANIAARTQQGLYSDILHNLFVSALVEPNMYTREADARPQSRIEEVITSLKMLFWHHRTKILRDALPKIYFAWDAHRVLLAILDNLFFGEIHNLSGGNLRPNADVERPSVDDAKFREHDNRTWDYSRIKAVTSNTLQDLQDHQRGILREVLEIDTPWMVHSNLLAKYGLPLSRDAVRKILDEIESTDA